MQTDIASISTKGQFVIPRPFRDILKLSAGTKMVIMCDGKHLLLKPISRPDAKEYKVSSFAVSPSLPPPSNPPPSHPLSSADSGRGEGEKGTPRRLPFVSMSP